MPDLTIRQSICLIVEELTSMNSPLKRYDPFKGWMKLIA